MVVNPKELGNIPVKPGSNTYPRDLGVIEDAADTPAGFAIVNGKRTVYLMVTKRADASTLPSSAAVRENLPTMQESAAGRRASSVSSSISRRMSATPWPAWHSKAFSGRSSPA